MNTTPQNKRYLTPKLPLYLGIVTLLVIGGIFPIFAKTTTVNATSGANNYTNWTQLSGKEKGFEGDVGFTWKSVAFSSDGSHIVAADSYSFLYTSSNSGAEWIKRTSAGERSWRDVASADDGMHLAAASSNYILTSNDGGETWVEQTEAGERSWNSIAISGDGSYITAVSNEGVFFSNNSGETWSTYTNEDVSYWMDVTLSSDGTKLAASAIDTSYGSRVYVSVDGGDTWTYRPKPDTSSNSYTIIYSGDGSTLINTSIDALYTSLDDGENWSITSIDEFENLTELINASVSEDGQNISVLGYIDATYQSNTVSNTVYVSSNGGMTWNEDIVGENLSLRTHTMSDDGSTIAALTESGIYISAHGSSWAIQTFIGSRYWQNVFVSPDNSYIVARASTTSGTYLYVSTNGGETWTQPTVDISDAVDFNDYYLIGSKDGAQLGLYSPSKSTVYISSDGINWTKRTIPTITAVDYMTISSDGLHLFVLGHDDSDGTKHPFISSNNGASWEQKDVENVVEWGPINTSTDGTIVLAATYDSDWNSFLLLSSDSGNTWAPVALEGDPGTAVNNVRISQDNNHLAIVADGMVNTSSDGGLSWIERTVSDDVYIEQLISSDDGNNLIASGYIGSPWTPRHLFFSHDGGATWSENTEVSDVSRLIISPDGSSVAMVVKIISENTFSLLTSLDYGVTFFNMGTIPSADTLLFNKSGTQLYTSIDGLLLRATREASPTFNFTPSASGTSSPTSTNSNAPQPITNTKPTFSGVAAPFATITITVHSDPIVCSTTADAEGNWSCTLPSTIPPGVHTILVEVTDPDTEEVTVLGPYYVQVAGSGSNTITDMTPLAPNTGVTPAFTVTSPMQKSAPQNAPYTASAAIQTSEVIAALVIIASLVWLGRITSLYSKQRQQ